MKKVLLELRNITRTFQTGGEKLVALDGIDLSIQSGEMIAIVGPSGCGKSTLMHIIGCLDRPTSGTYKINQQDVVTLKKDQLAKLRCENFGFIFQRYHLLETLTVSQNIEIAGIYAGSSKKKRQERACELLKQLDMSDKTSAYPRQLSGGQQQRVSIARALANGGNIILADEPTGALDSQRSKEVMGILSELHEQGHTIIFVTHDIKLMQYADRVISVQDGKIISDTKNEPAQNKIVKNSRERKPIIPRVNYYSRLFETVRTAWLSILAHRMRSFLATLGIIIGIASVICVIGIIKGVEEKIMASFSGIGANAIYASPDFSNPLAPSQSLTLSDASLIKNQYFVEGISPEISVSDVLIQRNNKKIKAVLNGIGEKYFWVREIQPPIGTPFNQNHELSQAQVLTIDEKVKNELFEQGEQSIGQIVLVNALPFRIIAIKENEEKNSGPFERYEVFAPYSTVMSRIKGSSEIDTIAIRIQNGMNPEVAKSSINKILTSRHPGKNFRVMNAQDWLKVIAKVKQAMVLLLSSIAFISLLVGGIGIMNIMLVSVAERTHEIGIRMAVGARKKDILQQFLIEAALICFIGGVFGVLLAVLISIVLENAITIIFSLTSIMLACGFSIGIGIIFGFLPAHKASKLDPAIALANG